MTMPPAAPRVVAAVTRAVQCRIRAILPACELRFVQSGSDLVRALDEARCDMMIVEVHFEDSPAAAALRCVLAREEAFPVVCVRDAPFAQLGRAALDALHMALGAICAQAFVDLLDYPDDEAGNARARATFERLLPSPLDQNSVAAFTSPRPR